LAPSPPQPPDPRFAARHRRKGTCEVDQRLVLVLELVGFETPGLLSHDGFGNIQHVLRDLHVLDLA
jgi:hypothetical protein